MFLLGMKTAARAEKARAAVSGRRRYPLMPLSEMPLTICFSKITKNTRIGTEAMVLTVMGGWILTRPSGPQK